MSEQAKKELTKADVAKLVKRVTFVEEKGATKRIVSPIKPDEVLEFKDYGDHVVVVTVDGQKFSNAEAV